jgi:asparagine synthase (glutamine-hydrolysing)
MEPAVIVLAMRMPEEIKIKDGHKKYVLREIAEETGLDHRYAFRPKRAAQYGSRVGKAISTLSKRARLSELDYVRILAKTHK